jgi:ABC-type transport system substrate-binding protein
MKLKIVKFVRPILASLILGSLLLSACGNLPALNPATATPTTAPTATPVPQKTLVICLGDEPSSLYLYGNSSQSMWSVLESIYDGPIDTVNYEPQPVILENIPTQENGEVTIQAALKGIWSPSKKASLCFRMAVQLRAVPLPGMVRALSASRK